jgi:hypothetical protein
MASSTNARFSWLQSQDTTQPEISRRSLLAKLGITAALIVTALWNVVLASFVWQGLQTVLSIAW